MTSPRFFGYGSLVNLATHDYPNPQAATLTGWRRVWRQARHRPVAFLSVEPHAGTVLRGITAEVPRGDWAALDAREHAYLRRDVSDQFDGPTAVYEANPDKVAPPETGHPVLLSYLDVVVAGHLALDPALPAHFFATTEGWSWVLDDRAAPIYPRAITATAQVRRIVEDGLEALGVRVEH